MPYCWLHMKQDAVNQKSEAPAKEIIKIKFGLDVHANQTSSFQNSIFEQNGILPLMEVFGF